MKGSSLEKHADYRKMILARGKASYASRTAAACVVNHPNADVRHPFNARPQDVFQCQVSGLCSRLKALNVPPAVIGLSGGLDSTLALLVAHAAYAQLMGTEAIADKLHVLTMPGFGTSKRTRGNANVLAGELGLKLKTIDVAPSVRQHFKDIGHDGKTPDVTFENAQARMRTMILMDVANMVGGIVIGTGDMSEIALGWCTYNGDHMSMFAVNAGVPKTVVRQVCAWWANTHPGKCATAIRDIIDTPVSPELLPAKDGKIAQKTEDRIGPYELHDFFIWHFVALGEGPRRMRAAAQKAFRGVYAKSEIEKWLGVFITRIFRQSFKRNCTPDGIRVFREVYFSPHAFWMPSDVALPDPLLAW